MRVALTAVLALGFVAGTIAPAAASCPSSGPPPVSSLPCAVLGVGCGTPPPATLPPPPAIAPDPPLASIVPPAAPPAPTTTFISYVTNIVINIVVNIINPGGTTTTTAVAATSTTAPAAAGAAAGAGGALPSIAAAAATGPLPAPTVPGGASGTGGGGGGIGGGGSFSGGSSGVAGMPLNPSDGFSTQSFFSNTVSGPGMGAGSGPVVTASSDDTPIGGASVAGTSEEGPMTPSVKIASLPSSAGASDEPVTVAMAAPKSGGMASPDTSSGFGLDGPAFAGGPMSKGMNGTMLLAGLVGVGVLGAGWAWKSLVV